MSSANTPRAGRAAKEKNTKQQTQITQNTVVATKPPELLKGRQPTAEEMRIAQLIETPKLDDPNMPEKMKMVMESTSKSSEVALAALADCDNDVNRAVEKILDEDRNEGEWETSGKKKKNRPPPPSKVPEPVTNNVPGPEQSKEKVVNFKEKDRGGRVRGPPRMHKMQVNKNWRNKENEKNERNLEHSRPERENERGFPEGRFRGGRGRGGGSGGPGPSPMGRRGGTTGGRSRTFQNRGFASDSFPDSIETWSNVTAEQADAKGSGDNTMHGVGNWSDLTLSEEWSEEDWTGSLTETKVFTPSSGTQPPPPIGSALDNDTTHLSQRIDLAALLQNNASTLDSSRNADRVIEQSSNSLLGSSVASQLGSSQSSLQSQFNLNQYNQQATESIKAAVGLQMQSGLNNSSTSMVQSSQATSTTIPYSTSFSTSTVNNSLTPSVQIDQDQVSSNSSILQSMNAVSSKMSHSTNQPLPPRARTQRMRLPPQSKIPESAVEMPDSAITALDVQFGNLEFGSDSSGFDFTSVNDSTSLIGDSVVGGSSQLNGHSNVQMSGNQMALPTVSNASSIVKDSFNLGTHLSGVGMGLADQSASSAAEGILGSSNDRNVPPVSYSRRPVPPSGLDGSMKSNKMESSMNVYNSSHQSSHSSTFPGAYVDPKSLASSALAPSTTSYNSTSLNSQSVLGVSSQNPPSYNVGSQSQSTTPYSSVQTSYSLPQSEFSSSQTSTIVTYSSQTSQQQSYSTSVPVTTHSVSSLHSSMSTGKLGPSLSHSAKDLDTQHSAQSIYDASHTSNSSNLSNAVVSTSGLTSSNISASSSLGLVSTSSSTSTTSVLKNSLSARKTLPNVAASLPQMLGHQYIMGQAGMPFYGLQQPLYSYEDMQLLQSRMPPLGYYDMQFSAPTSLTNRDPTLGSMAYADVKYSRSDNETNNVVTTMSQGQPAGQTHGQTYLNAAPLPPGYGYYFPSSVMPGGLHHYGPAIFSPMPPATNAHGATTGNQFQKASPYGSHSYSSVGATGNPNDLSASMYSKTHAQLSKQSYDKPGFHAGTPPPFNLAATQTANHLNASSAPYAAQAAQFMILPHNQHHSTMLHHHMQQDSSQPGSAQNAMQQRSGTQGLNQQKGAGTKQNFTYWNPN